MSRVIDLVLPTPNEGQAPFHADRYKVKFRGAFAATGGGKTLAGVSEDLVWAFEQQGSVGMAAEPNMPMVKRNLWPTFSSLLGAPGLTDKHPLIHEFNKSDKYVEFINGSRIWFVGLEEPENAEGPNIDFEHVDEARIVRKWDEAWQVLKRRLRGSRNGNRLGAWVTTTPSGGGTLQAFFEGGVNDHGDPMERDPDAHAYHWSIDANADNLPADYIAEVKRSHTGAAYQRFVLGKFARGGGTVFPDFAWERHVKAWSSGRPSVASYGADWGWAVPSCLMAVAWRGNFHHAVEESYGSHRTIDELIAEAKAMEKKWGRGTWWCDPENPEHIERFRRAGLDARPVPPESRRVPDGVGVLNDAIRGDECAVDPSCVNLLREIPDYDIAPGTDKPQKGNDHSIDAWRYAVVGEGRRPQVRVLRQSERGGTPGAPPARDEVQVRVFRSSKLSSRFRRMPR